MAKKREEVQIKVVDQGTVEAQRAFSVEISLPQAQLILADVLCREGVVASFSSHLKGVIRDAVTGYCGSASAFVARAHVALKETKEEGLVGSDSSSQRTPLKNL